MRRDRGTSIGKLLGDWMKSCNEARAGKIWRGFGNNMAWVLTDKDYIRDDGLVFKPRPDQRGRMMNLKKVRYVRNCPQPPKGEDSVPLLKTGWQTLRKDCDACPHRLPDFCCSILKAQAGDPHKEMVESIKAAVQQAKDIIG